MNNQDLEKYSSAVTLSDMEIFIFPELLYSLVLANIMSPVIWKWKEEDWFKGFGKKTPYRRVLRLKQFIMDNFDFNLDLETWGLTTKEKEISRFTPFMDEEAISSSNALFGYEGDKYYFDIDIRKHFGIDKYDSNVIPYWKTETIEAMEAFKYKDGFEKGAGECVSLSTLYAAALFIIGEIPLDDIFLMATPLHSQNFIGVRDGILTNNRRVVTKNMWFNGSELSAKAQRAMRNEQITIVSHNSGFIHKVYPEATINREEYNGFEKKLRKFLITDINFKVLCNFLRQEHNLQGCFQIKDHYHGKDRYIGAEKVYEYEHTSPYRVNPNTLDNLLAEIDEYEFYPEPVEDRILLNKFVDYFEKNNIGFHDKSSVDKLMKELDCKQGRKSEILTGLYEFCNEEPRLPGSEKDFVEAEPINITTSMSRDEIISYLESIREKNITADLAFYAYRDFSRTEWEPYVRAALKRNPVSVSACNNLSDDEIIQKLEEMPYESIYPGPRLAQPDEVWNYQRGDGVEKALLLANVLINKNSDRDINIRVDKDKVVISLDGSIITWPSGKGIQGRY
ncbi:MAG: hypothetical protein U5N58_00515 [Actinomycetota bacterium]|nr:hypothetical protein [Actinomycetota bacterium]